MDEIFECINFDNSIIKIKKITKPLEKDVWQIFDVFNNKWTVTREERIINYYKMTFVNSRIVLLEKIKKKRTVLLKSK